ncbi:MAG: EF-P lysine aminoacylase GenX [Deltaproteobacteria bacterium]|nr:EF-P lysine aminoacylase GenX [Deltaproteobacteria bacterium]
MIFERGGMVGDDSWDLARRGDALLLRDRMIRAIRRFFQERDFLEVETPLRIPAPAPESHVDAVASDGWFLHTSPELCMKRLLAAGFPRIFQLCKCFRAEERGDRHLPEFTILEWYRGGTDYRTLMDDCEALVQDVAAALNLGSALPWQGREIDLKAPWERITVSEAFARYTKTTAAEALSRDRFDEILTAEIEPHLGARRPIFLYEYPAELGALARAKEGDPRVAERFELYIAGMEMANAFSELTDPGEQRRRFEAAAHDRQQTGKLPYPMPEPFLAALSQMPPSAGIALGVDRLAMLFADKRRIDEVVAFTPESL